ITCKDLLAFLFDCVSSNEAHEAAAPRKPDVRSSNLRSDLVSPASAAHFEQHRHAVIRDRCVHDDELAHTECDKHFRLETLCHKTGDFCRWIFQSQALLILTNLRLETFLFREDVAPRHFEDIRLMR